MEIKLNTNLDSVARIANAQRPVRVSQTTATVDSFASSQALDARLAELPDIRPEMVEHARNIIGDPIYPPTEVSQRIATLLAMQIDLSGEEI